MARVLENSRLSRSSLLGVLFAVMSVVPMHPQDPAVKPTLAGPKTQATAAKQEPNQLPAPDSTPKSSAPVTPEEIRQEKIKADTKKLYQLSAELRAEVAKTYKESLSLSVLRKAEEIEKLARGLKALMNQEAAASR